MNTSFVTLQCESSLCCVGTLVTHKLANIFVVIQNVGLKTTPSFGRVWTMLAHIRPRLANLSMPLEVSLIAGNKRAEVTFIHPVIRGHLFSRLQQNCNWCENDTGQPKYSTAALQILYVHRSRVRGLVS